MRPDWREVPRGDISPQMSGMYVTMNPKGLIAMSRVTSHHSGLKATPPLAGGELKNLRRWRSWRCLTR